MGAASIQETKSVATAGSGSCASVLIKMEAVISRIGSVGMESRNSTSREMTVSNQPPIKPATAPNTTPNNSETTTTMKAIDNETRAPYSRRVKRSRPRWSTPNACISP